VGVAVCTCSTVGVSRLKGASGLREQVEDAAIELGYDSESAARIASRVVAEIRAIMRGLEGRV